MRLGFISDIHLDINRDYDIKSILCDLIIKNNIDCLIIAGDITESYEATISFIEEIKEDTRKTVYFVPGNHDLWEKDSSNKDTALLYSKYASHEACICGKIISLNDEFDLVGETGWYDYTLGSKKFSKDDFDKMTMFNRTWQDSLNTNWFKSNEEVNEFMLNELNKSITKSNKKIIAVTHMISSDHFTVPEDNEIWTYFNGFLGSIKYKHLYEKLNVAYSVMGHVHYRGIYEENDVKYICSCLNYHNEWSSNDAFLEVKNSLTILDI